MNYGRLPTERANPRTRRLDQLPLPRLLQLMTDEDARMLRAVRSQHASIARAIQLITSSLRSGGRLFFAGAGTSGRLGILEAAECPPTFHTPPSTVQALIAGGPRAVFRSREGAEDRRTEARRAIRRRVRAGDVVVGIAASGVTPFVEEALREAGRRNAKTVLVTCAANSPLRSTVRIAANVGPEVLTGSTRLKAGTATKLILNMLTLGTMVRLGKTYGNLMVDVRPTSRKLRARARRIVQSLAGGSDRAAEAQLRAARDRVKTAVVMAACGLGYSAATRRLGRFGGSLREALEHDAPRGRRR